MREYRVGVAYGDKYAAGFVVEGFKSNGIEYRYSDNDTSQNYLETLPLLTSVRLVDNPRLIGQFAGLQRRTSPGGKDRVDHSDRHHDDLSAATAGLLALLASRNLSNTS